jgi:hypothetical protein
VAQQDPVSHRVDEQHPQHTKQVGQVAQAHGV